MGFNSGLKGLSYRDTAYRKKLYCFVTLLNSLCGKIV